MANRKVIIRVDGNAQIGLGHIYRGIAIAEMLKDNFDIQFITKLDSTIAPIIDAGFNYTLLPENLEIFKEPEWYKQNIDKNCIIVLDGYNFTEDYQQKIKNLNFKLVYIDDLAKGIQKADIVINHCPGIKRSDYKTEPFTKLALGLDFAILRPAFLKAAKEKRAIKELDTAFVCFGGADENDFTFKVSLALVEISQIKKINIVIGDAYKHSVMFNLKKTQKKINVYKNLSENELVKVMKDSNFAIAPASTTLLELLAVKMPIITGFSADNQLKIYNGIFEKENILGIGSFHLVDSLKMKATILKFIKKSRQKEFENGQLIDGNSKIHLTELINKI